VVSGLDPNPQQAKPQTLASTLDANSKQGKPQPVVSTVDTRQSKPAPSASTLQIEIVPKESPQVSRGRGKKPRRGRGAIAHRDRDIPTSEFVPEKVQEPSDNSDDDFIQFIASSIDGDGLQLKEKAEIPALTRLEPEFVKTRGPAATPELWQQLDMLEALLKGTDAISFRGEFPICRICQKTCRSAAKLLQHCWDRHRSVLDQFG
jgi:hypothetical protein